MLKLIYRNTYEHYNGTVMLQYQIQERTVVQVMDRYHLRMQHHVSHRYTLNEFVMYRDTQVLFLSLVISTDVLKIIEIRLQSNHHITNSSHELLVYDGVGPYDQMLRLFKGPIENLLATGTPVKSLSFNIYIIFLYIWRNQTTP